MIAGAQHGVSKAGGFFRATVPDRLIAVCDIEPPQPRTMHSFSGYRQSTRRVEACFELDVAEKGSGIRRSRVGAGPTGDRLRICLFADGNGRKGETAENKGESNHAPHERPDTNTHVTSLARQSAMT